MQTYRERTVASPHRGFARLRSLTHLLDNALPIPGTKLRFGIDPIIGLLPGGGDLAMSVVSSYILVEAARLGLPRPTLLRMLWNLVFDALIGIVPMAGDLADFAWKANSKNLALIEAHLAKPQQQVKADYFFVALLILVFLAVVIAIGALTVFLIGVIWNAIAR